MRRNKLPVSAAHLLDQFIAYGQKAPEGLSAMPAHVMLRMLREAEQMTQAQLAARAGMPQSHLAVIETGKVSPRLATLKRLVRALHGDLVLVARFAKTPSSIVAGRIGEAARKRVARITGTMALESQGPDDSAVKRMIEAEEKRLSRRRSSEIWED